MLQLQQQVGFPENLFIEVSKLITVTVSDFLAEGVIHIRKTQEGCGGLRGEIQERSRSRFRFFQQPFALPENAQTLAGIAFRAAGKSVENFPAASKFAGKLYQQGISDSHSLPEFSENRAWSV